MIFVLPLIAVFALIVLVLFLAILGAICLGIARGFRDAYHQNFGFKRREKKFKPKCKICNDLGWTWKEKPDYGPPRMVACTCQRTM